MEYIKQKLRDMLGKIIGYIGKNYGIYYGIYLSRAKGYIWHKLRGILDKTMGYIMGYDWQYYIGYRQKLWDIVTKLTDIFG